MDDILVYGKDGEEHDEHLYAVLQRPRDAGVMLNKQRRKTRKRMILFLGRILEHGGISTDPGETEAVREMQAPKSVTQLRAFFGTLNHLMKLCQG